MLKYGKNIPFKTHCKNGLKYYSMFSLKMRSGFVHYSFTSRTLWFGFVDYFSISHKLWFGHVYHAFDIPDSGQVHRDTGARELISCVCKEDILVYSCKFIPKRFTALAFPQSSTILNHRKAAGNKSTIFLLLKTCKTA